MDDFLSLQVTHIIQETPDTLSLQLKPLNAAALAYKPGQFLTLVFNIRGKEIRRSFSISSSPFTDEPLRITVKRIPNGEISTYILQHIKQGDVLKSLPPAGRFVLEPDKAAQRDIFLIAAGSGITPVLSILKSVLLLEPMSRVTLIYSSRNEISTIFYKELNALAQEYPGRFDCIYIFSDPEDHNYPYRAHLNLALLKQLILAHLHFEQEKAEFYLCGPFTFMRMADMIIVAMGFDESRIHKENFKILAEESRINRSPVSDTSDKKVQIDFRGNRYELTVPYDKSILKTALGQGINLPYSCQGGVCGICAAICRQGEVRMSVNEVLTDRDTANGWVLTCTGYAASSFVALEVK